MIEIRIDKNNYKKIFLYLFAIVGIVIHIIFWYLYLSGTLSNYSEVRYGDYKIYGRDDGLYCYNTETKKRQKLTDIRPVPSQIRVCDEWVYFKRHRTFEVYRLNIEKNICELVLSDSGYFRIANNKFYYDSGKAGTLFRANLNGSGIVKVTDFIIDRFEVKDSIIYFRRNKDHEWFRYVEDQGRLISEEPKF